MALLRLKGRRGDDIIVNSDEISSIHEEGGFSYRDYVLILKNGTRYLLNYDSYSKIFNLINE